MGRLEEATERLSEAVRLAPQNVNARYDLGVALGKPGRCADALPHFSAALRIAPQDEQARAARAECEGRLSRVLANPPRSGSPGT